MSIWTAVLNLLCYLNNILEVGIQWLHEHLGFTEVMTPSIWNVSLCSPDLSQKLLTLRVVIGFFLLLREKRQVLAAALLFQLTTRCFECQVLCYLSYMHCHIEHNTFRWLTLLWSFLCKWGHWSIKRLICPGSHTCKCWDWDSKTCLHTLFLPTLYRGKHHLGYLPVITVTEHCLSHSPQGRSLYKYIYYYHPSFCI